MDGIPLTGQSQSLERAFSAGEAGLAPALQTRRHPRDVRPLGVPSLISARAAGAAVAAEPAGSDRAGDRARTGDIQLGRLALYQLSYTRVRLA